MWELRVRILSATEEPAAGLRLDASFDLRLAAGAQGEAMWMPAQASAETGPDGRATLKLPSPTTLGDAIRLVARAPNGSIILEISRPRAALAELPELLVTLDPELPPELVVRARLAGADTPLARREVGLVARREGSGEFEVLIAGRTDDDGAIRGPYPRGLFAEASAVVRLDGNFTLPVHLDAGRLPATLDLEVPLVAAGSTALEARAPAPPPAEVTPPTPSAPPSGDAEQLGELQARLRDRPTLAALGLAMVVGTFLRLYHLGGPSLWTEELSTWRRTSYDTIGKVFTQGILSDVHPPGYYLVLLLFRRLFGDSEWALRLPSALAGVVAIGAMFALGRRLWSDREGLIAAGLTAVLWAPVRYSQEARATAMALPFAALATWAWVGVLRDLDHRGRIRGERLLAYVMLASTLCYMHYAGLLLVGLQSLVTVVYAASKRRRRAGLGAALATGAACAVLYLPWLGPLLDDLSDKRALAVTDEEYGEASLLGLLRFLFNESSGLSLAVLALCVLSAALAAWRVHSGAEELRLRLRTPWVFALTWLLGVYVALGLGSAIAWPMLSDRNLLVAAPAVYLLVARALTSLPLPSRAQEGLAGALVGASLIGFVGTQYYEKPHRQQIREAVAWVIEASKDNPDAPLIGTGTASHWNYYFKRMEAPSKIELTGTAREVDPLRERFKAEGAPARAWLMLGSTKADKEFMRFFERWMHQVRTRSFYGVEIVEYQKGATHRDAEDEKAAAEPEDAEATETEDELAIEDAAADEAATDGAATDEAARARKKKANENKRNKNADKREGNRSGTAP